MPQTKPTSEQVTFLASGTGASQRTVLDKLRDVVSVKEHDQRIRQLEHTRGYVMGWSAAIGAAISLGANMIVRHMM